VLVAVLARVSRRLLPWIVQTPYSSYEECWEWMNAANNTVRLLDAHARGDHLSQFQLRLAAELPRIAASELANSTRIDRTSDYQENAEICFAVCAFSADVALAGNADRRAQRANQCLATAQEGKPQIHESLEADLRVADRISRECDGDIALDPAESGPLGPLWMTREPQGWSQAWVALECQQTENPKRFAYLNLSREIK
jgi:hypothetical protein